MFQVAGKDAGDEQAAGRQGMMIVDALTVPLFNFPKKEAMI